ncbi:hypothetical protein DH2020_022771 [Rehmannia glutinosa]|uniref:F-box domain-containing protein n=1 Tax=Rehmannia glutinosa TaxID=99300 RepID=A0ABR0W442_REHGL
MTEANRRRIPPEIVEEILCKLPVMSLNRFRCVSKSWQSLISDHCFVRKHLSHAAEPNNLSQKALILHNTAGSGNWKIHASYDGLLCIHVDRSVYIWNPCLKTHRKICDGLICTCSFGFGYDSRRDDYKLCKLSYLWRQKITETEVYSLGSGSWTKCDNFPQHYSPHYSTSVFINGSIHWLALGEKPKPYSFALISFDLSDNKYREVPLPECWLKYPHNSLDVKLCVLKGMLCVIVDWKSCFVLWAMKDYNLDQKSWTKILDIPLDLDLAFSVYYILADVKPFYMYENGEVLIGVSSERGTELLICKDNSVLFRQIIFPRQSLIGHGFVHVESLISPLPLENGEQQIN